MTEAVRITSSPPVRTSLDYAALRERGMDLIRQLAEGTWTDHNVHDPGVTLLEAFSYAMTELGFRIQLDMADLLRSGEAHAPADLVPAHRVLPSGPVTPSDLRNLLLDHPLVGDALIAAGMESEVAFFEDPASDPPFTYAAGAARVRPRGLFEVMLEFEEREWNSNTYTVSVDSSGVAYTLDLALPHWDEAESAPFREGADIINAAMMESGGVVFRPLAETQTYFGHLRVDHAGPAGPVSSILWFVLRITDDLANPALVAEGILAAARAAVEATGTGSVIERFADRVRAAYGGVRQVERYLRPRRNLAEEAVRLSAARVQEIALRARIEVTGGTDLERLLSEILFAIDRELSPPVRFHSLEEMRAEGKGVEEVFDGPLLRHGFLDRGETEGLPRFSTIFTSDVLRILMRLRRQGGDDVVAQENPAGRDIVAVTDLALSSFVNNRPVTTDARECLRLVEVERYRPRLSLAKSRIIFVRDDVEVSYDAGRVEARFLELRRLDRATVLTEDPKPVWPTERGESLPVSDYYPFQNDLPRNYGVGEAGLPRGAGVERRARALQVKGYLLLFEQFLADLTAQIGHINSFFSADPAQSSTYFTRPLLDVPEVQGLLTRFTPQEDWEAFVADEENPHRLALQEAVESRERFLDRRNRMFDHLLARYGEETVAWGQELHRRARKEIADAGVPPAEHPGRMEARRRAANERLIRDKAAFLSETPELTANRLQALGSPMQRLPEVSSLERDGGAYRFLLALEGESLLRSSVGYATEAEATIAAEEALALAPQPEFYDVTSGPLRRHRLKDGPEASARVLGESLETFSTVTAARAALEAAAASFASLTIAHSPSPMERRIAHLTGIRGGIRRRLLAPVESFFEIHDEADADGIIEKRWRLWERSGLTGDVLMSSVSHFVGSNDPEAIRLAQESIARVLRYGMDDWSYRVSSTAPDSFHFEVLDPLEAPLGLGASFTTEEEARRASIATLDHLYQLYSAEGFHLVEHLLLRPRRIGDPFLSLPLNETEKVPDPYSQRLSLIFPSGFARDFSLDDGDGGTGPRTETTPHRFRDPEFRRHAERTVRQACPAHLLPAIYWVDRRAPGTPESEASFDGFEDRFFTWLESVLIPGSEDTATSLARARLIESLNAIGNAHA